MTTRPATAAAPAPASAGPPAEPNPAAAPAAWAPKGPAWAPKGPAPTCDDCFEELAAAHACQTCHLSFCPAHAAEHRRRKSTRAHQLVALGRAGLRTCD